MKRKKKRNQNETKKKRETKIKQVWGTCLKNVIHNRVLEQMKQNKQKKKSNPENGISVQERP